MWRVWGSLSHPRRHLFSFYLNCWNRLKARISDCPTHVNWFGTAKKERVEALWRKLSNRPLHLQFLVTKHNVIRNSYDRIWAICITCDLQTQLNSQRFVKVLVILLNRVAQQDCLKIPRLIRMHHHQKLKTSCVLPCPGFTAIKMHAPEQPWIPLSLLRHTMVLLCQNLRLLCQMQLLKHHQPQWNDQQQLLKHHQLPRSPSRLLLRDPITRQHRVYSYIDRIYKICFGTVVHPQVLHMMPIC